MTQDEHEFLNSVYTRIDPVDHEWVESHIDDLLRVARELVELRTRVQGQTELIDSLGDDVIFRYADRGGPGEPYGT